MKNAVEISKMLQTIKSSPEFKAETSDLANLEHASTFVNNLIEGKSEISDFGNKHLEIRVLLSSTFLERLENQGSLVSLLVKTLRSAKREETEEISKTMLESKLPHYLKTPYLYELQDAMESVLGPHTYLALFDQSAHPAATIPSAALQDLAAFSNCLRKVAKIRSEDFNTVKLDLEAARHYLVNKMPAGGVASIALNYVKKAKENPKLIDNVSKVLDNYFATLNKKTFLNVRELDASSCITEDLVLEYFFRLGERPSYSEKCIYLKFSSILKLIELHAQSTMHGRQIIQKAVQKFVKQDYSTEEETHKFVYQLTEDQLLQLIDALGKDSETDKIVIELAGYFAAFSGSIPAISLMVSKGHLSEVAKRVSYEKLAIELIKTNVDNPKDLVRILSNLKAKINPKTYSEFSHLLESVVVPVLLKDYHKVWNKVYNTLIYPGQKDLVSNLIITMLKSQVKMMFTNLDGRLDVPEKQLNNCIAYLENDVSQRVFNKIYDEYFTGNLRDHLRAVERAEIGFTDRDMMHKYATADGMYVYDKIFGIIKRKEKLKKRAEKEEVQRRLENQVKSRSERITGFLKAAGIDNKQSSKDESKQEHEAGVEEDKNIKPEKIGDQQESPKKDRHKNKPKYRISELRAETREEVMNQLQSFEEPNLVKPEYMVRLPFLTNKITNYSLSRPNIAQWSRVLLVNQDAPDDITPRSVPYSELDASNCHKLLDLAIDLREPFLLVLAEKACGMYAQPLSLELRSKYVAFKETMLRNKGNPGLSRPGIEILHGNRDDSRLHRLEFR